MTSEQMRAVCETYLAEFAELGIEPKENNGAVHFLGQLTHAAWMCDRIPLFLDRMDDQEEGDPSLLIKAHTWLGFVQGILWMAGLRTVQQMRDENRPKVTATEAAKHVFDTVMLRERFVIVGTSHHFDDFYDFV